MVTVSELFADAVDILDSLAWYYRFLISVGLSVLAVYSLKRFVMRRVAELVNETKTGWDNDLYIALESKVVIFFGIICFNLSLIWVSPDLLESIFPFVNSLYILLLTMMLATTVKVATPPLMAWLNSNKKGGVSVTGGNHFVSIIVRMIIWLIGINAILKELSFDITGILASFALFR